MEEHQDWGEDDPSLGGLTSGLSRTRASQNNCRGYFHLLIGCLFVASIILCGERLRVSRARLISGP